MAEHNAKDAVELLDLNDDVLEIIFRHLNIIQQHQMAEMHFRFHNVVQTIWRIRARRVILSDKMFHFTDEEFKKFIRELMPHVHYLCCYKLSVQKLRLLDHQRFQSITHFKWIGSVPDKKTRQKQLLDDEDVLMLQRALPNLCSLKLCTSQITGQYLSHFPLLKSLCLENCQNLNSKNFPDIFINVSLKKFEIIKDCDEVNCCDLSKLLICPTLEHLKIADYHLCFVVDIGCAIAYLPSLHILSIYSKNFVNDVMKRVARNKFKRIVGFKYTGILYNFSKFFNEVGNMKYLHNLSLYSCRSYLNTDGLSNIMLLDVAKKLPELREIHFHSCDMESYEGIIHFVKYCKKLHLINLTNSNNIGDDFIWSCIKELKKQESRTKPLEIWIYASDIDINIKENPRYPFNFEMLKINTKHLSHNENVHGVLKFTFDRSH